MYKKDKIYMFSMQESSTIRTSKPQLEIRNKLQEV